MAESPERRALEHLLSTLCVGAFAVPVEEVARRIEALYRPAPDAAERERVIEECAELINDRFPTRPDIREAIRRLAEKP